MNKTVKCPVCDKTISEWYINQHLDFNCSLNPKFKKPKSETKTFTFDKHSEESKDVDNKANFDNENPSNEPVINMNECKSEIRSELKAEGEPELVKKIECQQPEHKQEGKPYNFLLSPVKRKTTDETEYIPLSELLRPKDLDSFIGQEGIVGKDGGILRILIENDRIPSMILWGPPGSGKTTLARIIANKTNAKFKEMSATMDKVTDVRRFIDENRRVIGSKRLILFVDEIHRFNKSQQDAFLPYIEKGTIILIGATTENPSFRLNPALLSRCRAFILNKLQDEEMETIIQRAYTHKSHKHDLSKEIVDYIIKVANGDARVAISIVEIALDMSSEITIQGVKLALQRTHEEHSKDTHFDLISAFHKSIRGGDENASLYWLLRMIQGGEDPLYIARRLVRFASEDIGLADNTALQLAVNTFYSCKVIGYPECGVILAHCTTYFARCAKSVEVYRAYKNASMFVKNNISYPVPLHIRNAPTKFMKELGFSKGYKYNPDYDEPVDQTYLPPELNNPNFFE